MSVELITVSSAMQTYSIRCATEFFFNLSKLCPVLLFWNKLKCPDMLGAKLSSNVCMYEFMVDFVVQYVTDETMLYIYDVNSSQK